MSDPIALPRFVVFLHTVSQHQEALRQRLIEQHRIPSLAPFAPEGEIGTWQGIEIALYPGSFRETSLVPVLEHNEVEFIFSIGLVGSLSDDLRPGDLVTPSASVRGMD